MGRLAAILLLPLLLAGCGEPSTSSSDARCPPLFPAARATPRLDLESPDVSRDNLHAWIEHLVSPALEGRRAGTDGARRTAARIAAAFEAFGLEPLAGAGFCQPFPLWGGHDWNVLARPPASAGEAPAILVTAHYDGQGKTPAGGVLPGADDNASGVAALLEAARLAARQEPGSNAVVFAALGGEEIGLLGANAYLAEPRLPPPALVVVLDMVGRPWPGDDPAAIGFRAAGPGAAAAAARLRRAAGAAGVELRSLEEAGVAPERTDADAFAVSAPTLLLSTGVHDDQHRRTDVPERLDLGQIERAARLVLAAIGSR